MELFENLCFPNLCEGRIVSYTTVQDYKKPITFCIFYEM